MGMSRNREGDGRRSERIGEQAMILRGLSKGCDRDRMQRCGGNEHGNSAFCMHAGGDTCPEFL